MYPIKWIQGLLQWVRMAWLRQAVLGVLLVLCSAGILLDAHPSHQRFDSSIAMEMDVDECEEALQEPVAIRVPFVRVPEPSHIHQRVQTPCEASREPEHAPPRRA